VGRVGPQPRHPGHVLDGRVALVTGASAGLAACFARVLHGAGAHVIVTPAASVINVASVYGIVGSRTPMAGYNATKGALINLTRHLAAVWGHDDVRVNPLAPGLLPQRGDRVPGRSRLCPVDPRADPAGRMPEPSELDGPLLFLATDASSYMTGQALVIEGGWTAV
jgi:NAD(P)-dependent dehydrogenase (short-subunit alcohol dehydrogenase family)